MNDRASAPTATRKQDFWVLLGTSLASAMVSIDATALHVALPAIQADLGASGSELLWIINAYALFLAALILVGGSLGDRYGRRLTCEIGSVVFALSSISCAIAPNIDLLIAARAVQGVGGALMVPSSLAILSSFFAPHDRGWAIGTWLGLTTVATVIGPVLGGVFASADMWPAVFYINVPMAIFALYILHYRVPESRDELADGPLDIPGAVLGTAGLVGITYAFIELPEHGMSNIWIVAALVAGVAALVAFVLVERHGTAPLVSLSLFDSRTFTGANIVTFLLYAALGGALFFFPLNLIQVQGYPAVIAGFTLFPVAVAMGTMSTWAGMLGDRYGNRRLLTVGPVVVAIGFGLMAIPGLTEGPSTYWSTFFPPMLFVGVGMAITSTPLTSAVMNSVPTRQSGVASGVNNAITRVANVLAIAVMGAFMLVAFRMSLFHLTEPLGMASDVREALLASARDLGNTQPPEGLALHLTDPVTEIIRRAFVSAFRQLCLLSSLLCLISAGFGYRYIEDPPRIYDQ